MQILQQFFLEHAMQGNFINSKSQPKIKRSIILQGLWGMSCLYDLTASFIISFRQIKKKKPSTSWIWGIFRIPSTCKNPSKPIPLLQTDLRAWFMAWLASSVTVLRVLTNDCTKWYSRNNGISSLFGLADLQPLCYPLASSGFAKHASLWWSLSRQEPLYPQGQ